MEPGRGSACALVVVRVLSAALLLQCALAATYTVGDDKGWDAGVNYATWAAKNTFKAGDVLVFTYSAMHSVLEVSQADYTGCSLSNAINTLTTGNDSITLSSTKTTQYFICGTPGHCAGGMALQVTISSSTSAPAPARARSPAKAPSQAPSKAPPPKPLASPPGSTPSPEASTPSAAQSPPASSSSPPSSEGAPPPPPGTSAAQTSFASWFPAAALALAAAAVSAALF